MLCLCCQGVLLECCACVARENGALWREVAMLRTKHHKQQQIVNKVSFSGQVSMQGNC